MRPIFYSFVHSYDLWVTKAFYSWESRMILGWKKHDSLGWEALLKESDLKGVLCDPCCIALCMHLGVIRGEKWPWAFGGHKVCGMNSVEYFVLPWGGLCYILAAVSPMVLGPLPPIDWSPQMWWKCSLGWEYACLCVCPIVVLYCLVVTPSRPWFS